VEFPSKKLLIARVLPYSKMGMDNDWNRFNKILKGKVRKNLKGYLGKTDLFARKGDEVIKIPVPQIDIPHFRFGQNGGVGQGDGDIGDSLTPGERKAGSGGEAGDLEGEHFTEAEVTIDELARMLGEELGLPNIEPKGENRIVSEKYKVKGIASVGPESLRQFRRGYLRALKRQIATSSYDPHNPLVIPIRDDMRYRSLERVPSPLSNAVLIYMMDVSGSMGAEQKRLVRNTSFWISAWLRTHYKEIEERFIIHDTKAREVDRKTFFSTTESGGTLFTPAYHLCTEMIAREYDPSVYNIYPLHFSDGDNYNIGTTDTKDALRLLDEHLLPASNLFCYGQCLVGGIGEGEFIKEINRHYKLEDTSAKISSKVRAAKLYKDDDIADALRHFLRTGR